MYLYHTIAYLFGGENIADSENCIFKGRVFVPKQRQKHP